MTEHTVQISSEGLPPEELARLLEEASGDAPGVLVSVERPSHRGLDPTIAVAALTVVPTLLTPFLERLADRLFRADDKAALRLSGGSSSAPTTVEASASEEQQQAALKQAVQSGVTRIEIIVKSVSG